jgi:hypothetical protein
MDRVVRIAVMGLNPKCSSRAVTIHVEEKWANRIFGHVTCPMAIISGNVVISWFEGHDIRFEKSRNNGADSRADDFKWKGNHFSNHRESCTHSGSNNTSAEQ